MNETQLETALAYMREKNCGWPEAEARVRASADVERYSVADRKRRQAAEQGDNLDRLHYRCDELERQIRYLRGTVPPDGGGVPFPRTPSPREKARVIGELNAAVPPPDPGRVGAEEPLSDRDTPMMRLEADGGQPIPQKSGDATEEELQQAHQYMKSTGCSFEDALKKVRQ